jgi:NAD+ kinase
MAMPTPRQVLILYHPRAEGALALAEAGLAFFADRPGLQVERMAIDDGRAKGWVMDVDLVIVLGGDGSMLRAGRLTAPYGVPVLGVNLGRLGFLPEAQRDDWREVFNRVLAGEYWVEKRMMLRVEHWREAQLLGEHDGLNEAVVGRGSLAPPARLKTLIDGYELTTYVADGLIIATPTGSTAYSLAAGGPILPPELKNITLVAIAPHLSMDRAIVLAEGANVEVIPYTDSEHAALLSVDGQVNQQLLDGDRVRVCMGVHVARFVRVRPPSYFYASLMARMNNNPSAGKAK